MIAINASDCRAVKFGMRTRNDLVRRLNLLFRSTMFVLFTFTAIIGSVSEQYGRLSADEPAFIGMSEETRRQWIIDQAAEYEVRILPGDRPLKREEPVLRFNDNITGVVDAVLFVWTVDGRPEASASFWYRKDGLKAHEFISLSRNRITTKHDGTEVWNTEGPGVAFKPIAKSPAPGQSKPARLTQMRQLARRCEASVASRSGERKLRLLPQPMMRYESQLFGTQQRYSATL